MMSSACLIHRQQSLQMDQSRGTTCCSTCSTLTLTQRTGGGRRGRSVEPHVKSNMTIGWRIRTGTAQEHEDMSVTVFLMGGVLLHAPSIGLPLIGIQPSTHHPQPSTHPGNSTSAAVPALAHSSTRLPPSSQRSAACLPPGDDLLQKRTKMTSKASPV